MSGANLSCADIGGAQTGPSADLSHALLLAADLSHADLRGADLSHALPAHADLTEANLYGANLSIARLFDANLTYSVFIDAQNLDPAWVKTARFWEKAFYDDKILKALGLPPEHNAKLSEQLKKAKELQQRQSKGQAASSPSLPKQQ